eukprot:GHVO01049526.1.p2 GENE.GHVO01049526.1~~GHVO01049526.1.p2  ORF type:complete len:185 (-),score=47.85 GHVO01049526.1:172-726(-)
MIMDVATRDVLRDEAVLPCMKAEEGVCKIVLDMWTTSDEHGQDNNRPFYNLVERVKREGTKAMTAPRSGKGSVSSGGGRGRQWDENRPYDMGWSVDVGPSPAKPGAKKAERSSTGWSGGESLPTDNGWSVDVGPPPTVGAKKAERSSTRWSAGWSVGKKANDAEKKKKLEAEEKKKKGPKSIRL